MKIIVLNRNAKVVCLKGKWYLNVTRKISQIELGQLLNEQLKIDSNSCEEINMTQRENEELKGGIYHNEENNINGNNATLAMWINRNG